MVQAWIQAGALFFVIIAAVFGSVQLRDLQRSTRFSVLSHFNERRSQFEQQIGDVIATMPICNGADDFDGHAEKWAARCRLLVGELNLWCQYVEEGLFQPRLFMSVYHSQIIRLVFVLRPFMDWEQARIGTRYGRRVIRVAESAKRYHCLNPLHRDNVIRLGRASGLTDPVAFDPRDSAELTSLLAKGRIVSEWLLRSGRFQYRESPVQSH